jgi:hypothetical protein
MWKRLERWWYAPRVRSRLAGERERLATTAVHRYRLDAYPNRAAAQTAARAPDVVAVVRSGGKHKWVYLMCPCDCGDQLVVNLMTSQRPSWRLTVRNDQDFTLYPSLWPEACGAHFWLWRGQVIWCR